MLFPVVFLLLVLLFFYLAFVVGFIDESKTVNFNWDAEPITFFNCFAELLSGHCSAVEVSDSRLFFFLICTTTASTLGLRLLIFNDFDYHRFKIISVAQHQIRRILFNCGLHVALVVSLLRIVKICRALFLHCWQLVWNRRPLSLHPDTPLSFRSPPYDPSHIFLRLQRSHLS